MQHFIWHFFDDCHYRDDERSNGQKKIVWHIFWHFFILYVWFLRTAQFVPLNCRVLEKLPPVCLWRGRELHPDPLARGEPPDYTGPLLFDMSSLTLSDIFGAIISFDLLCDILADISSNILSGVSSNILSDILWHSLTCCLRYFLFRHSFWHIFWHSFWHIL